MGINHTAGGAGLQANSDIQMQQVLSELSASGAAPALALHSCCAPCSSYVLEALSPFFEISVYYYNPNIAPRAEYERRKAEQQRLIETAQFENAVCFFDADYSEDTWHQAVLGLEQEPEGGARCLACFEHRLAQTALFAEQHGIEWFCSTLSVSPHKDAAAINEIGQRLASERGLRFLPSDFKKRGGYQRSLELSKQLGLYRQNYCGCAYSRRDTEE